MGATRKEVSVFLLQDLQELQALEEVDKKKARNVCVRGAARSILETGSHSSQPPSQSPPQRALRPHSPPLLWPS